MLGTFQLCEKITGIKAPTTQLSPALLKTMASLLTPLSYVVSLPFSMEVCTMQNWNSCLTSQLSPPGRRPTLAHFFAHLSLHARTFLFLFSCVRPHGMSWIMNEPAYDEFSSLPMAIGNAHASYVCATTFCLCNHCASAA